MAFCHRLEPYCLPDTGNGGVPDAVWTLYLFATGMIAAVSGVEHAYCHCILAFCLEGGGDVEAEGSVTACVAANFDVVHPYVALPVYCAEVEHDVFPFPFGGYGESAGVPESLVTAYGLAYAGKR